MTTLKLIYTQDYQAVPEDSLDLLCFTGEHGFQIANNGWQPIIGRGKVQESLTLHVKGDSQDEVIAYLESVLRKWHNFVLWSQDYTQKHSVWLQAQWEDETYIRQARLLSFDFQINSSPFGEYWQNANFTEATITFERLEWERIPAYPTTITIPAGQSVLAGMIAFPTSIVTGDINGRIVSMRVNGNAVFNPNTLWFGFRRNRHGDPSYFKPLWDCELGAGYGGFGSDTTLQADATASRGSILATNFSSLSGNTLARKYIVPLANITSYYDQQRGKYLVLYRAMNSDDTTVTRARIVYGSGGKYSTLGRVEITGMTNWKLFEMGAVSIPAERFPRYDDSTANALLTNFFIGIDAERVSGTGSLLSDCLILIPIDEAFLKTYAATGFLNVGSDLFTFQNELGDTSGYIGDETTVGNSVDIEQRSWGIPPEITQNKLYLIMAGDETAVNSYTSTITMIYIPRWSLARGTE